MRKVVLLLISLVTGCTGAGFVVYILALYGVFAPARQLAWWEIGNSILMALLGVSLAILALVGFYMVVFKKEVPKI
jgi:hypothetical protein